MQGEMKSSKRFNQLDSLRGLAAVAVALCHSIDSFKDIPNIDIINAILGESPVIFFFLLSGFVLSLSMSRAVKIDGKYLIKYLIRRILRLFPVVILSIIIAIILRNFYVESSNLASDWLKSNVEKSRSIVNFKDYLKCFAILNNNLNPPLWTIRVEIICSLFLPIIFILRKNRLFFSSLGIFLAFVLFKEQAGVFNPLRPKIGYMFTFYVGLTIMMYANKIKIISKYLLTSIMIIGFCVWIYFSIRYFDLVVETMLISLALIAIISFKYPFLSRILKSDPLSFMGKISYSFYALHCPVLFFTWGLLNKIINTNLGFNTIILVSTVFFVSAALTIPIAFISQKYIETPFNKLGHKLNIKKLGC
jgi:peptidoglycan/LPS O-acetylase OafA/YrhL